MNSVLIWIGILLAGFLICLNIIATMSVWRAETLDRFQCRAQTALIWLFPLLGPLFILRLLAEAEPEAIATKWLPDLFLSAIDIAVETDQSGCEVPILKDEYETSYRSAEEQTIDLSVTNSGGGGGGGSE